MEEETKKPEPKPERGLGAEVADTAANEVASSLLGELLGGLFNV